MRQRAACATIAIGELFQLLWLTAAQYEVFLAAVPQVLGSEPMTHEQMATAVAKHIGAPKLRDTVVRLGFTLETMGVAR